MTTQDELSRLRARREDTREAELLALCDRVTEAARRIGGDPEQLSQALEYVAGLARNGELRT